MTETTASEHFDVLIVGAGISGVGAAYHLTQSPGHELRRAGGAGELRRHVADPQISRHPLGQRPLHLRLPLQALDRRADRHGRRDPEVHGRGDRGERPRPPHPLPPQDRLGARGRARKPLDHRGGAHATPARRCASPPTSSGCARATTATPKATRRSGRAWRLQGPHRPSADLAGGPGLQGQEGRGDRLRRDGRDAGPGDRRRLRPRHDAAALADLFHPRPQRQRAGRHAARAGGRREAGSTRSCAARSCTIRTLFTQPRVRGAGRR